VITFGPVPSRRLGHSLGINNIPPKACSYSCVYCQLGPTAQQQLEPRAFYPPEEIHDAVAARLAAARRAGQSVDYLTFVPDGEPTLDLNLGKTIELLRPLGVRIAVISNASLLWRPEVRERISAADWVSVKVDAVDGALWRRINRPHPELQLDRILHGIGQLAREYRGELVSETMLVEGLNDGEAAVRAVASFLARLAPAAAYLAVPTRPPAEASVHPPGATGFNRAFQIFSAGIPRVECLIGYEGNAFAATGDVVADLLSITAVHPMREDGLRALLTQAGETWAIVEGLVDDGLLKETEYAGRRFYLRSFPAQVDAATSTAGPPRTDSDRSTDPV
jgi:wyosine [tRNA(Phe)-imidazoG37] synthetase (radical SAM superfamily)